MEKLSLIIPPSPFLTDERVFPFLGILKVASNYRQEGGQVDVMDLSGVKNYTEVVGSYVDKNPDAIYGITATTPQFPQAVDVLNVIREKSDTRVILGGAHATMVGTAHLIDSRRGVEGRGTQAFNQMISKFDTVVIGDGEKAIFEAVGTDGVIDAGDRKSPLYLQRGTLEDYPLPARDLIDIGSYHYQIDGKDAQSMIAQLGCPFECGFCGGRDTPTFRIARTRTTESIINEVDVLVSKYNKRGVMFYDDELNINNDKLTELMEGLIEYQSRNDVELRLRGFVKAELFTREQADLMYKAGFRIMLSGVESGDDGILKIMKKHTTREINTRFVRYSHEAGLKAKALMSLGHPDESEQTIQNSLNWVLETKPDDVDWTIITQYAGSPYFDYSVPHPTRDGVWVYTSTEGAKLYSKAMDYSKEAGYYKGIPDEYTSYVWTDGLTPNRLVQLRDNCERVSRDVLKLPPIVATNGVQYEKSMGLGLPDWILRTSKKDL